MSRMLLHHLRLRCGMAPFVPGRCRDCGRASMARGAIGGNNVTDFSISGGAFYGGCEHCGGDVELIEGRFNIIDGGFEMISGPEWSEDVLVALRLRLKRAVDQGAADAEAIRDIDPGLANDFERTARGWSKTARANLLLAIYNAVTLDYEILGGNLSTVKAAVLEVLQFAASHGHPPLPY